MIIYVFDEGDKYFVKLDLPMTVSGMYPINVNNMFLANITSKDGKWVIELGNTFISNELMNNNTLENYKCYTVSAIATNEKYYFFGMPKYDSNTSLFDITKTEITLGNNSGCDIYYNHNNSSVEGSDIIKIVYNEQKSYVETNIKKAFTSGERIISGNILRIGDYINYYGLRVIFLGKKLLVNNPNNKVRFNQDSLRACPKANDYVKREEKVIEEITPLFTKDDYFFKTPRFNYIIEEAVVNIDEPPAREQEDDTPMILTVGPQLTMACTSLLTMISYLNTYISGTSNSTRLVISMATIGVTLLGTLLWPTISRKINKKRLIQKEKKRQKKYTEYLDKKSREIELIKESQKSSIIENQPPLSGVVDIIEKKPKNLWQRNIEHEDFLSLRLGMGNAPTKIQIRMPEEHFELEDEDNLLTKLKEIVKSSLTIEDIPISYNFTSKNITGIVGNEKLTKNVMDSLFLQMMTFHSYTDLKIIVYSKNPDKWDYLRIIPHCWNNQKTVRYFATTIEELSVITNDLEKIFDARVNDSEEVKLEDDGSDGSSKKNYKDFRPYYLFFVEDMSSVRNVSLMNKILRYKRNMGFSIILTSENISSLPSETNEFICIEESQSAIITNQLSSENQQQFKADFSSSEIDLYDCASKLANIPVQVEKEKYELPSSLSFLELYNLGKVEQLNSLARWNDNNPVISLSVPIGIDQNGEIFKMDIHEKAFGPHGLVAGTTGSGKSEWIVTYILSLAVNFSPDEVQFVLIDYKGGGLAMSFENAELGVKLPHLAGTITNLDKSEIFRSIAAIESELKRRQTIFNDAREKLKEGSMNIYKYQQYYRKGLVDEPLSHLLIICDEFAELKSQQQEFMDQLISTSRIGRSLGIHLILATQKPSGVVNEQIWSNSKFKVCLKVQDKGDSNEVLKKPDAAFLKQTGAFYLQVGNDDYFNLGQSAWAGAKYYPSDIVKKKIDDSIQYIDNIGRTVESYEEQVEQQNVESQGEELLNIVSYISNISKEVTLKSKPLWLTNIPEKIYLLDTMRKYNRIRPGSYNFNVVIGEYDEPREQKQGLLELNLANGNIAIIGQIGSGKEKLLSTIIYSSFVEHTPYEIAYYIIDFGAETLKKFAKYPHVGEVVFQDEMDKVAGVLDLIIEELDKRKELLSDYNGSYSYYNKVSEKKLPLIVTVINGYDVFNENLPKLQDYITNMFRDAPKYGIIFIVTVSSQNAIRQRQLQYFNHTIVTQLPDDSAYRTITNCRKGLIPKRTIGRGICKTKEGDVNSYCEFQTAFIATEEKEIDAIKSYADKCIESYNNYKVKQLAKVPDNVTSSDLIKYITTLADVPIGYNYYEKDIAKYNFATDKIHLISGKNIKENLPFIYGLTSVLANISNVKIRVVDMMAIFNKPILDVKLFNDELDTVMAALEKDAMTRTETQDMAINIIIGVGQFKKKLSKAGVVIFQSFFEKLQNSKNIICILIDDYDKLRTLKFEEWFDNVDTTKGIWLGSGVSTQSLFQVKEISAEDKKFEYEGLAFNFDNGEYKVMKTVMDGDE